MDYRLNGGGSTKLFSKKFFRKLFRQWRWHSGSGMLASLCRVILVRWAAVARGAVRTRAWKARRWAARTRIATRIASRPAFWECFCAWFAAARAGTLFRRGTLFWDWEGAEAEVRVRSASWPP